MIFEPHSPAWSLPRNLERHFLRRRKRTGPAFFNREPYWPTSITWCNKDFALCAFSICAMKSWLVSKHSRYPNRPVNVPRQAPQNMFVFDLLRTKDTDRFWHNILKLFHKKKDVHWHWNSMLSLPIPITYIKLKYAWYFSLLYLIHIDTLTTSVINVNMTCI